MEKKFTTILCSDIIGYSKMMRADELGTLKKLDKCRKFIDPLIEQYSGRIFNTAGDSVLVEFSNPCNAVEFSVAMQDGIRNMNIGLRWRIGIHIGDVFPYGSNLLGDTVNLAARIESSADLGGVCMSSAVYELVRTQLTKYVFESRGPYSFKNIDHPVDIWAVRIHNAEINPSANVIKEAKFSREQLVKSVINDRPAINKTLQDAQTCRRNNQFGPATRILLWRITKKCNSSVDELISMAENKQIPVELHQVCVAVVSECCKGIGSSQSLSFYKLLQGPLGNHPKLSLQFLKQAAKTDSSAQLEYSWIVINDPLSLPDDITKEVKEILYLAEKQNVPAMLKLTDYYAMTNNKKEQFCWLWVLRSLFEPSAQGKLERLSNTISKFEFNNWKIEAEALIDELKFKNVLGG